MKKKKRPVHFGLLQRSQKWPFCPLFKMSFIYNIKCIFCRFSPKTYLTCVESHFLFDFDSVCKMGNFLTLENYVFFLNIKCICKPFPHRTSLLFSLVFKILSFLEYLVFLESRFHQKYKMVLQFLNIQQQSHIQGRSVRF